MENDLVISADAPAGARRAKYVLGCADLHAALGLPDSDRVVSMYATPDPPTVCVIVEGPGIDPQGGMYDPTRLAWQGLVEAPPVSWQRQDEQ